MFYVGHFRCTACKKILYAGEFLDHEEDPYCEPCYERLFAGNRKMYAPPNKNSIGEIDTTDPLKEIKSSTRTGKLDIKRFSARHNIPDTLKKSQSKSYKHQAKLHKYMLGNASDSIMMDGRMKYIYSKLQNRLHKMIIHQCYTLQKKLIERVDDILKQEILEFDHNHVIQQQEKILFDREELDLYDDDIFANNKGLNAVKRTLETDMDIPDFVDKNGNRKTIKKHPVDTNIDVDNESDMDTQELIARLTTNKLLR